MSTQAFSICKCLLPPLFFGDAAAFGALAVELLPAQALNTAAVSFGSILLVALIGAFLPVPWHST
jgi:hypothetical protein